MIINGIVCCPQRLWAKEVKRLSGNRCECCGVSGDSSRLEAHHIMPKGLFPELSLSLENGIALCHICHYKVHGGKYDLSRKSCSSYRHNTSEQDFIDIKKQAENIYSTRIIIELTKDEKAKIKAAADAAGETVNGYIKRAIAEKMEREGR